MIHIMIESVKRIYLKEHSKSAHLALQNEKVVHTKCVFLMVGGPVILRNNPVFKGLFIDLHSCNHDQNLGHPFLPFSRSCSLVLLPSLHKEKRPNEGMIESPPYFLRLSCRLLNSKLRKIPLNILGFP